MFRGLRHFRGRFRAKNYQTNFAELWNRLKFDRHAGLLDDHTLPAASIRPPM